MNKPVSIKDIANHFGVSSTTVSFVLNDKGPEKKISKQLIIRIKKYADEINYKPNYFGQSLRTGKSRLLVFMVDKITNRFVAKIAKELELLAFKNGYNLIFCSHEKDKNRACNLIDLFVQRRVEAFIISPTIGLEAKLKEIVDSDVPLILFDRYFPHLNTHYIEIDNQEATFHITSQLIGNNIQKIGFITTEEQNMLQIKDPSLGYLKAMRKAKLKENILKIPLYNIKSSTIKMLIHNFLMANPKIGGLIFTSDFLGLIGLKILREKFPRRISKIQIGILSDNDIFNLSEHPLIKLNQPYEKIAEDLIKMTFSLLNQNFSQVKKKLIVINQEKLSAIN